MLNLRSLGQVVGFDQGITGLFQGSEEVEGLLKLELDSRGRSLVG
ncbi:MAG: hypothetical protein ABSG81_11710 [Acidimicrobiales bacterium]|jgi:hypothetical protein